jgi:hypothetical protein
MTGSVPWFSAPPATDEMMRALDWPAELMPVQDAYWMAQRKWEKLDQAYKIVVGDLLSLAEGSQAAPQ